MRKAKVTYYAPEGDNPVVFMGAPGPGQVRFIDGQSVEMNTDDNGHLIEKLQGNPHFDVELGEEMKGDEKRKPGRPRKTREDTEKAQADYAERENEMRGAGGSRLGSDYQGGPVPGGMAHGVPGIPPLGEGNEGGNVSGTITSDERPGSKPADKHSDKHAKK